ncbi:MAG: ABC transporter permease [Parvibaculales bacterium]
MLIKRYEVLTVLLTALLLAPIAAVLVLSTGGISGLAGPEFFGDQSFTATWSHLLATVLPGQLATTLLLMTGVGLFTAVFGLGAAWCVTFYKIPGKRVLEWGLMLPLAIPTYISAYAYAEAVDSTGPWSSFWAQTIPQGLDMRSLAGAVFCMGVVLTPYVYISARASFLKQSVRLIHAARALGAGPFACFWRIGLPLCRPALFVGVALALMECLNDIGAVEYLGVRTLTVGVYDTWLARGQLGAAVQMALVLLVLMAALIFIEKSNRRDLQDYGSADRQAEQAVFRLTPIQFLPAVVLCLFPILFGFVVPVMVLVQLALSTTPEPAGFLPALGNSVGLALGAGLVTILIGLVLVLGQRFNPSKTAAKITQFASIGYAVPGTVLGLGVLICLSSADDVLAKINLHLPMSMTLFLTGSVFGLLFAYCVRFMSISYGTLEAGLSRIPPQMDIAARSLGAQGAQRLQRIYLPLLRPSLIGVLILVFVDAMKELPATLILRPFDFETLATQIYTKASLGLIEEAAAPALLIILTGIIPVIAATKFMLPGSDQPARHRLTL